MWLAVNNEMAVGEAAGVANGRRVRVKSPHKPTAPPKPDLLKDWRWEQSEMSSDFAAQLGFAVGSVSVSGHSRTLLAEYSNTATVEQDGQSARYGVAARLVVGATSVEGKTAVSIPVLAAEAQLGHTQASVNLSVNGYVGGELAELLPTDISTLNVDTYSALTTAMSK